MGWTGVQYSAFRVALAIAIAHVCWVRLPLVEGPPWPLLALGLPASIALAFGWRDRALAGNLLLLVGGLAAFVDGAPLVLPANDVIFVSGLILLHLFVPITPFGSWDARERIDPRGDWVRPAWMAHAAWLWLALIHLDRALGFLAGSSAASMAPSAPAAILGLFQLAVVVATFVVAWRPAAWIAITLAHLGWITAFGAQPGDVALLLVHAFAADPAWWPGRSLRAAASFAEPDRPARLFYDGDCGFCHRSIRFVLSEEAGTPEAYRLRFAPLQGDTFEREIANHPGVDRDALPDSIVLILEDGTLLTKSAAVCEAASRLGGLWRGVGLIGSVLPTALLDVPYDAIARVRKKLFENPKDACPILPPDLRGRFDF